MRMRSSHGCRGLLRAMRRRSPLLFYLTMAASVTVRAVHSLSVTPATPINRHDFFARSGAAAVTACLNLPFPALADDDRGAEDIGSLLEAKAVFWDGPPFPAARYSMSSLLLSSNDRNSPPTPGRPAVYPGWLAGYYAVKYKFVRASYRLGPITSFPPGRRILSRRTAGAGLGTCISLPNVGYSPSAAHAMRFVKGGDGDGACEDLAYNIPRRFKAFWPQAKVLAVQTNGGMGDTGSNYESALSPKCLVTGEGCAPFVNPNVHAPASRAAIEFDGPTRQGGRLVQSSDVTMLNNFVQIGVDGSCRATKTYSQYNTNQDVQTFYREITVLESLGGERNDMEGRIRVAAFLPRYIRNTGTKDNFGSEDSYDENEAVAIYDYSVFMTRVDEKEAASV